MKPVSNTANIQFSFGRLQTSTKWMVCNGLQGWSQREVLNWVQISINQSWTVSFPNSIFIFCPLPVVHVVFMGIQRQFLSVLALVVVAVSQEWGGVPPRMGGKFLLSSQPACWAPNTHMALLNKQQSLLLPGILVNCLLFSNSLICLLQPPPPSAGSPPSPLPSWLLPGRGREELFIVCLLKMRGFYILMSTK